MILLVIVRVANSMRKHINNNLMCGAMNN